MRHLVVCSFFLMVAFSGCTESEERPDPVTEVDALPYRDDRDPDLRFEVPVWEVGDTWRYEYVPEDHEEVCKGIPDPKPFLSRDEVVGEGTRHDLEAEPEIYRVRSFIHDCEGGPIGERDRDHLKAHLVPLDDDGSWEQKMLFPLEDGKRWRYHPPGGVEVTAEASHVPEYSWNGRTVQAWKVHLASEAAEETFWFGVTAENILFKESHRITEEGKEPMGTVRLIDRS
ncbi:MAG: hypothetical protein KY455_00845 [Euryarchaeota archaeon]|nr:hypothetical protein [Euryarchaeota archaeon]